MLTPFCLADSLRTETRQSPVAGPIRGCKLFTGSVATRCDEATLVTKLTPHPNVVLFRHAVPVPHNSCRGQYLASLAYSESLHEKIQANIDNNNCFTEEYRKCILLQVTHAVRHIHKHGAVHGHISPENVILPDHSTKGEHLVLSDLLRTDAEGTTQADDMKQLTSLYCFVLTNGKYRTFESDQQIVCKEPEVAKDMLSQMTSGTATAATDVLKHPFFWSDDKKLNFLLRSYDIIEFSENKAELKTKLNENTDGCVFAGSWLDNLDLTSVEIDMCKKVAGESDVSKTAIRDKAAEKHKGEEKAKDVWELYRFIRNMKVHFTERKIPIRNGFQTNETSGLWNFFSRRFPKFFYRVHGVMNAYRLLDKGGVKEIYVDKSCENACLPPDDIIPLDEFEQKLMPIETP